MNYLKENTAGITFIICGKNLQFGNFLPGCEKKYISGKEFHIVFAGEELIQIIC